MQEARRAFIEIGSNTVKLAVLQKDSEWIHTVYRDERVSRLGTAVSATDNLESTAIQHTVALIREMVNRAEKEISWDSIDLFGTWALRTAKNSPEFIEQLHTVSEKPTRILTGEEEAVATFLAVRNEIKQGPLAVIDLGGGSVEISYGENFTPEKLISLPLGARRLFERYPFPDPPSHEKIEAITHDLLHRIPPLPPITSGAQLVLTGGARVIAGYIRDKHGIEPDAPITSQVFSNAADELIFATSDQLRQIDPERADILAHGALILKLLVLKTQVASFHVSETFLSPGVYLAEQRGHPLESQPLVKKLDRIDFPPLTKRDRIGEVVFLLRRPDGTLWLQTKANYPEGEYRLPGGGMKPGEDPLETVFREVEEETGFTGIRPMALARLRYTDENNHLIPFTTWLFRVDCSMDTPINQDPSELITDWKAATHKDLKVYAQKLATIGGARKDWGVFRATAIQKTLELQKRGAI